MSVKLRGLCLHSPHHLVRHVTSSRASTRITKKKYNKKINKRVQNRRQKGRRSCAAGVRWATWSFGGYGVVILRLNFVGIVALLVSQITTVLAHAIHSHTHTHSIYRYAYLSNLASVVAIWFAFFSNFIRSDTLLFKYPWKKIKTKKQKKVLQSGHVMCNNALKWLRHHSL